MFFNKKNYIMTYKIIAHDVKLYIVAVAYGQNYEGFPYARILISDDPDEEYSDYSKEVSFEEVIKKQTWLHKVEYSKEITKNYIPKYKTFVPLKQAKYIGRGHLVKVHHAPVGIKAHGKIQMIEYTHIPMIEGGGYVTIESYIFEVLAGELFNQPNAVYYKSYCKETNDEWLADYKEYKLTLIPNK